MKTWHHLTQDEVLKELGADPKAGLSAQEGKARLEKYGPNELEGHKQDSMLKRILDQLRDPMIIVLLAAAVLSYVSAASPTGWIRRSSS